MSTDEKPLKFKMPFGAVMWLLFVGNALGFIFLAVFLARSLIEQKEFPLFSLLIMGIGLWVITLIADIFMAFVCIACFKVKIYSKGISCFNFWGFYSFVLWDEMHEIKMINFLGLKYVRVFCRTTRFPLWVPLFIKNRGAFSQALSEFTPTSNLLKKAFAQNI